MALTVAFFDRPGPVLDVAGGLLSSQPVVNNLILSLLTDRMEYPQPGRYWVVADGPSPVGVVFQSPLDFPVAVSPMPAAAVAAVVTAIAGAGVRLPGVGGEAATAAQFAGQWSDVTGAGAEPFNGQRIDELAGMPAPGQVRGRLRPAEVADGGRIVGWMQGFADDTRERAIPEEVITRRVVPGVFWLWDDDGPCSVAAHTVPAAGVTRVLAVYTPPGSRRRGYAGACVSALSARLLDAGHRCILYTDLANPTSNQLYRRIGYRPAVECLRYRFL